MKQCARAKEKNRRESIEESSGMNEYKGRGRKGRGVDSLRKDEFEELNTTTDVIVWFSELGTGS